VLKYQTQNLLKVGRLLSQDTGIDVGEVRKARKAYHETHQEWIRRTQEWVKRSKEG
jgi:hypothetical protein